MRKDTRAAAIVLAGGKGSRLHELTERCCKPAVPLGTGNLIIDWTMGNLRMSDVPDLIVATQYMPARVEHHLRTAWMPQFDGRLGIANGVTVTGRSAGYLGTADAVRQLQDRIGGPEEAPLLVVAADHVYRMDYGPMIAAHRDSGAGITVACTILPAAGAQAYGIVDAGPSGRIRAFVEKPSHPPEMADQPGRCLVSMGIYVCDRAWLRGALARGGDDFGHDILPDAVARGEAQAFRAVTASGAPIYWKDVGTLDSYRETGVELTLNPWLCPRSRLPHADAPCPEAIHWARRGSVVLPGARVEIGADLHNVVVAPGARIPRGTQIGHCPEMDRRWFRVTPGGTTLVTPEMLERRLVRVPRRREEAARRLAPRGNGGTRLWT